MIRNERGVAMTIVIVISIVLTLLAGFAVNYGYNKKKIVDLSGGRRDVINYRAQAGLVDANTRMRLNYTPGCTYMGGGCFRDPNYDPPAYQLDIDNNGVNDTSVDIGPVTNAATGARAVNSTGLDV